MSLEEELQKSLADLLRQEKAKRVESPLSPLNAVPQVIEELVPVLGNILQTWFDSGIPSQLSQLLSVLVTDKAKQQWVYYQALKSQGFTEDQAMMLILKDTDIVDQLVKNFSKRS